MKNKTLFGSSNLFDTAVPFQMVAPVKFSLSSPLKHWSNFPLSHPSPHCTPTTPWSYTSSTLKMTCVTVPCKQELCACCFFILSPVLLVTPVERLNSQAHRPCCGVDSRFWPCFAPEHSRQSEPKAHKLSRHSRRVTHTRPESTAEDRSESG